MKWLLFVFLFLLLASTVSAVCYNQDNAPFCSKDDSVCVAPNDIDTDSDGWSDSCDAFAQNSLFQVDYDGDGIGYGLLVYDCNDLDEQNTSYCGNLSLLQSDDESGTEGGDAQNQSETGNNETNDDNNNDGDGTGDSTSVEDSSEEETHSQTSSDSQAETSRGARSHSHLELIYVSDPSDAFSQDSQKGSENVSRTQEGKNFKNETYPLNTSSDKETTPESKPVFPEQDIEQNKITGAFLGGALKASSWPFWILVLVVFFALLFVWRKKKKDN